MTNSHKEEKVDYLWLLLIIPYLLTGYWIGMLSNSLYFDDRPNKELPWHLSLLRLLLFPSAFLAWEDRKKSPSSLRSTTGAYFSTNSLPNKEAHDNYCKLVSLIWPLYLLHLPLLVLELIGVIIYTSVVSGENLAKKLYHLLERPDLQAQLEARIDSIKLFLTEEITEYSAALAKKTKTAEEYHAKLSQHKTNWESIKADAIAQNMPTDRIDQVLANLRRRKIELTTEDQKRSSAIQFIGRKQQELSLLVRMLDQYKATSELLLAPNSTTELDEGLLTRVAAAQEVMDICRHAYALDMDVLDSSGEKDLVFEDSLLPSIPAPPKAEEPVNSVH